MLSARWSKSNDSFTWQFFKHLMIYYLSLSLHGSLFKRPSSFISSLRTGLFSIPSDNSYLVPRKAASLLTCGIVVWATFQLNSDFTASTEDIWTRTLYQCASLSGSRVNPSCTQVKFVSQFFIENRVDVFLPPWTVHLNDLTLCKLPYVSLLNVTL